MATTVTAVSVVPFDEYSPRYKCCCGCCHVRCASFAIGCLQTFGLISLLSNFGRAANAFRQGVPATAYIPTILSSIFFVCCLFAVICLFIGICQERPRYLTPMLVLLVACIAYYLISAIFVVIVYATNNELLVDFLSQQLEVQGSSYNRVAVSTSLSFAMIIMVISFLIGAVFDFWWYRVIKCCYTYLKDKQDWKTHHPGTQFTHVVPPTGVNTALITRPEPGPYLSQGGHGYPPAPPSGHHYTSVPTDSAEHQFVNPPPSYDDATQMDKPIPSNTYPVKASAPPAI